VSNEDEDEEKKKKKEVAKLMSTTALDGFSGFVEEAEGDDRPQGGGVIQGTLLKFTNEAKWVNGEGDVMSPTLALVAHNVQRIVQKWINQKPAETIFVAPGEKFPNVEEMNKKAPKSEWREDFNGKMVGPWQPQSVLYLIDPETLDKFTYPTSTTGGSIALRELSEKIRWMRRHRGPDVGAVVTLSDTHMNTGYGGRQRPHFIIKKWIGLDDGETALAPPQSPAPALKTHEVKEPSLEEEMDDELPTFAESTATKK
jgi:hypothetical protein